MTMITIDKKTAWRKEEFEKLFNDETGKLAHQRQAEFLTGQGEFAQLAVNYTEKEAFQHLTHETSHAPAWTSLWQKPEQGKTDKNQEVEPKRVGTKPS